MVWNLAPIPGAELFAIVSVGVLVFLLVSLLDDLITDLWYWLHFVRRQRGEFKPLSPAELTNRTEQPLAVLIAVWQKPAVMTAMLEHLRVSLHYRNFQIFVGVYPNDVETIVALERLCLTRTDVHRIDVPHQGPTCRADCLNWVVEGVFAYEAANSMQFAGVVLYRSGDVLHPLSLAYFNYLLPRKDTIQLPVVSVERPWHALVAGAIVDEYAQIVGRDMVLRERAGIVPSAGAGMCLSHRALQALVGLTRAKPFDVASLGDDYGVGKTLAGLNMRSMFAASQVEIALPHRSAAGPAGQTPGVLLAPLDVRRCFPDTFAGAYRHKARRLLDLLVQRGNFPAQRSLAARYLRLREHKLTVTAFIVALAYLLLFGAVLTGVPALDGASGWLTMAVGGLLLIRLAHRAYFTARLYGWPYGAMALPRAVVGHAVDLVAAVRAWRFYLVHVVQGKQLTWDKTMQTTLRHDPAALHSRHRLGELLQAWQAVDGGAIDEALREQQATHLPLGRILVSNGWLDEETLAEAIAYQADLPRGRLSVDLVQAHAGHLPLHVCTLHRVIYIGTDSAQSPLLAVASPLPPQVLEQLKANFGELPRQRIVRESEVAIGLRLLRGVRDSFAPIRNGIAGVPLLGDMLIEQSLLSRHVFETALEAYRPERHGRLGDYLVDRGVIVRDVIERVVLQQRLMHAEVTRLGR